MAPGAILVIAIVLLILALYSHYNLYASMYSIPDWTRPLGLVVSALIVVGSIAYVFVSRK